MKRKRLASTLIALAVALSASHNPALASSVKAPQLRGTLFFHRYTEYKAWDASMWSLDLSSKKLTRIDGQWSGMYSPINAHPAPDGKAITFMGSNTGLAAPEWDIYISYWRDGKWSEPLNLSGPNGKRDEDPKFSPDGKTIIYKEDGVLTTIAAIGGGKTYLTSGAPESSMPYFTPDGKGVLFERKGAILLLRDGKLSTMKAPAGISSYYPIAVDNKKFLFTRVQASHRDGIYWGFYDGRKPVPLFFNSDKFDSSDSYPYQDASKYIFLTSGDYSIWKGGYNLMVADLTSKKNWNIDTLYGDINSGEQELGPAWTAARYQ